MTADDDSRVPWGMFNRLPVCNPRAMRGLSPRLLRWSILALVACGPVANDGADIDAGIEPMIDARVPNTDANTDASTVDAAPPPENAFVFAHSETQLYRVDPETLNVKLVGAFQWPEGADSMTDIAIDRFGRMIGVSFDAVYEVDENNAVCVKLANLASGGFNGLSFLPNEANPTQEILIGADQEGDVYQLDPQTGVATLVGNYGNGYTSSGDLVSVQGAGTFATVNPAGGGTDLLARIDTDNGYAATIIGSTGYDGIWGLGYWRNEVFGFTSDNQFLLIDVDTGAGTVEEASSVSWWGAGVTTLAPIIE